MTSEAPQWKVPGEFWLSSVQIRLGHRQVCSVSINQFGNSGWHSGPDGTVWPDDFHEVLKRIVIPEAKLMVPSDRGRYGAKGNALRREYLEAVALVLNKRGFFPVQP